MSILEIYQAMQRGLDQLEQARQAAEQQRLTGELPPPPTGITPGRWAAMVRRQADYGYRRHEEDER